MKIIIYVDYSSLQFNKDFDCANLLIENEHNVLMVTNNKQLQSAIAYYDILLYGYSYTGQPLSVDIDNLNLVDFLENIEIWYKVIWYDRWK